MFNDFFIYVEPSQKRNKIRIVVSKKGLEIKYIVNILSLNRMTLSQKNLLTTIKKLICEIPNSWKIIELNQGYTISKIHLGKSYFPLKIEIINNFNDSESCEIQLFNEESEKDLERLINKLLSK